VALAMRGSSKRLLIRSLVKRLIQDPPKISLHYSDL